jgi:hypothetical protein
MRVTTGYLNVPNDCNGWLLQVKFVPVVPVISIVVNTILVMNLDWIVWVRWLGWLLVGELSLDSPFQ